MLDTLELDKTTCGLASTVASMTPTMDAIADWGVQPRNLGHGFRTNQQLVMPFYQAYREVRNSIHSRLEDMGPVATLKYGLPKDFSEWNEVIFVSEKQVIEELATHTLTEQGLGTKLIANFTRLMGRAFGRKKASVTTPKRTSSGVKDELRSPGALGEEFEGDFEGFVPEGKFISAYNHVRSYVQGFAERLNNLWKSSTDLVSRCFTPRKSPMIFRWPSNNAWNPREWITKRLNLRQKTNFWNDDELLKRVYDVADSHIESRRRGTPAARHLQGEIISLMKTREAKRSPTF